jgi:hypothetical protein
MTAPGYVPQLGDLVDAEYIGDTYGTVRLLRGIVTHLGKHDGQRSTSVQGHGSATTQNRMPVHLVAPATSEIARAYVAGLLANAATSERIRRRLAEVWELTVLRRIREVTLSTDGTISTTEARARAHEQISGILFESGPSKVVAS